MRATAFFAFKRGASHEPAGVDHVCQLDRFPRRGGLAELAKQFIQGRERRRQSLGVAHQADVLPHDFLHAQFGAFDSRWRNFCFPL